VNISAGANVLLQGVHPGFHSVPLHHINFIGSIITLPPAKSIPNNKEQKYPEQEVQVLLQLLTVPKAKSLFIYLYRVKQYNQILKTIAFHL
jgi:hypothetical protein